jgi:Tfp pilus assembly protein PilN
MEFNQINLTTHDHVDRRIIYAVLGSVALLLAIFTLFNVINGFQAFSARGDYQSKIKDLQQQAKTLSSLDQNGSAFDTKAAEALQKRSRHANYLIALDIFPWVAILDELEKTIPPQVVLDRFLPDADLKSIRITGYTPSVEPITRFQDALGKSEMFQSVVLENMDFGAGPSATKGGAGNGAMHFEMICVLNLKTVFPEETYGRLWITLASAKTGNAR